MVFWCKFGGVLGGEGDDEDDLEDTGDGVDILEDVVCLKLPRHCLKNLITSDSSST